MRWIRGIRGRLCRLGRNRRVLGGGGGGGEGYEGYGYEGSVALLLFFLFFNCCLIVVRGGVWKSLYIDLPQAFNGTNILHINDGCCRIRAKCALHQQNMNLTAFLLLRPFALSMLPSLVYEWHSKTP